MSIDFTLAEAQALLLLIQEAGTNTEAEASAKTKLQAALSGKGTKLSEILGPIFERHVY